MRTKLRNLRTANIIDKTFRAGEKLEQAFLEEKKMQFLYRHGDLYHFMDQKDFEEIELPKARLKEKVGFLKENAVLSMTLYNGALLDINMPNFVELKIKHSAPGVRADTVKAASKLATLETGAEIFVPLFVNKGDMIKIDTRSGKYISRV